MTRLIFVRHGNTFCPNEKAVWLGPLDDLPLVAEGKRQAISLAEALLGSGTKPAAIFCGPLQRMLRFAEILARGLNLGEPPIIDQRLTEIDYGGWRGLSNEEVIERFGECEFFGWYEGNFWPNSASWNSNERDFNELVRSFVRYVVSEYGVDQTVIAVTSHGVLKCLGESLGQRRAGPHWPSFHRVNTGNFCDLICGQESVHVISWNESPNRMLRGAAMV